MSFLSFSPSSLFVRSTLFFSLDRIRRPDLPFTATPQGHLPSVEPPLNLKWVVGPQTSNVGALFLVQLSKDNRIVPFLSGTLYHCGTLRTAIRIFRY